MQSYKMEVSKREGTGDVKAYVKVGEVEVFYPLLSELGLDVEPNGKDEDGFPTYADEKVQFVFDAVLSAVKASARNKLFAGTVELREGNKIAETVEELLSSGERSGLALAIRREYFASFKSFLNGLGKSAAYVAGMYDIVSNTKNLPYQSDARKKAIIDLVTAHAASLPSELVAKYERTILNINDLCSKVDPLLE